MTYSEISIVFNEDLTSGGRVRFSVRNTSTGLSNSLTENWVTTRGASSQVSTGQPTGITGERSAINFVASFNLDYNSSNIYQVSRSGKTVLIKSKNELLEFYGGSGTKTIQVANTSCLEYEIWANNGESVRFRYTKCSGGEAALFVPAGDAITVFANVNSVSFTEGSGDISATGNSSGTTTSRVSANISFSYENYVSNPFEINSTEFQESSIPCEKIKVKVTTSELATTITSPYAISGNTENPFYIEVLRGSSLNVKCKNSAGKEASKYLHTPSLLSEGNFSININSSPFGATAIVSNNTPTSSAQSLNIEYSLDGASWQSSEVFTGLEAGDYTLFVRDNYGCSFYKSFFVDDFNIDTPFDYISESNSLAFAERVEWGNCSNRKNYLNTLSYESKSKITYKEVQLFQNCDYITTQIKANYSNIEATAIENGVVVGNFEIQKKTNSLRISDKRDARKYSYDTGLTGVYFLSGKIYDYNTGIDTGNTYSLNGGLPEWGVIGNYIQISNAWHEIKDIVFDEEKLAEVLLIEVSSYTEESVIVGTYYNRFEYDVFEFDVNMNDFNNKCFQVQVKLSDEHFENKTYLSEFINVSENQEDTVCIEYSNPENTDIYYTTGIKHKIRVPIEKVSGGIEDESDTYKTDTSALLLGAELFKIDEYKFEKVTEKLMHKITQALSHKDINIEGLSYVKNSNIEVEGAIEDTNLYKITAKMVRTSNGYSTESTGATANITGSESVEIPNLISYDGGFISFQ